MAKRKMYEEAYLRELEKGMATGNRKARKLTLVDSGRDPRSSDPDPPQDSRHQDSHYGSSVAILQVQTYRAHSSGPEAVAQRFGQKVPVRHQIPLAVVAAIAAVL